MSALLVTPKNDAIAPLGRELDAATALDGASLNLRGSAGAVVPLADAAAMDRAQRQAGGDLDRPAVQAPAVGGKGPASRSGPAFGPFGSSTARPAAPSAADPIGGEDYARPSAPIADAVLAPRYLSQTFGTPSPDGQRLLETHQGPLPELAAVGKPFVRLGGLEIDPAANRARRFTVRGATGFSLLERQSGKVIDIAAPAGASVSSPQWSPDGNRVAYLAHFDRATYLYVADAATGRAWRATTAPLLATLSTSLAWLPDSRGVAAVLVPEDQGPAPIRPPVASGPQVRLTSPEPNKLTTYPDLLEDAFEKRLLAYHVTGQLALIDAAGGGERRIGAPAMIQGFEVSPDGAHALVHSLSGPMSYTVPVQSFAAADHIWRLADGAPLALVEERPVDDGAAAASGAPDPNPKKRGIAWRPDGSLGFLQPEPRAAGAAADEGAAFAPEAAGDGPPRGGRGDRVMAWAPPFDAASLRALYTSATPITAARPSEDGRLLFVSQTQGEVGQEVMVPLDAPDAKVTLWRGKRLPDRDPTLVTKTLANGAVVVRRSPDGRSVYLSGIDYDADPVQHGPRSWLDRVSLQDGSRARVYESGNAGSFERLLAVLDDAAQTVLVTRESPTRPPDTYERDLGAGRERQLTANRDFLPDLTTAERRRITVKRADGFELAVNVTLPKDRKPGERLPALLWFYPREYVDQGTYDQTRQTYNKNAFPKIGPMSPELLVRQGYAVIQPDAPIVGERGRINDNYVGDLRNNVAAVIDALDREGLIDRARLAVGGHSYGSFSTANALVHTPFFKAGLAGDGCFNRTLTPFGFQSEERTLWQARDLYTSMSPLLYANQLNGALLLYTGAEDQNTGTAPINSWRFFDALESLGKTAALYVYPYEDHGPVGKATLLDILARWESWLDKYVKGAA